MAMELLMRETREVCVGTVEGIPAGEGRTYEVGKERIAVFRLRDGSLRAVQAECPHKQGPLAEGITGGCAVICPLHSRKFDLSTGECLTGDNYRLRTYPVREDEGLVLLSVAPEPSA